MKSSESDSSDLPLVRIDGAKITLMGWRGLTPLNIIAFLVIFATALIGFVLGGAWKFLGGVALALLLYGLWATYRGTFTKIEFAPETLIVDGQALDANNHGPFRYEQVANADGIDDEPGWLEIWLESKAGAPLLIAQMSTHADGEGTVELLNERLAVSQCG